MLGTLMLLLPRRYALVPMLVMACFISPGQRIVIATLDFNLLRVMVLFGWARVLLLNELRGFQWKKLDTLVLLWTLAGTVTMTLLYGTAEAFVYRMGFMFDALGMYFLFRVLVRAWADVISLARCVAWLSIPVAAAFLVEQMTARNMFSIFGGVPEITVTRNGRLRCQGPFPHPILAGCFWASLAPLIGALWWQKRHRWLAPVGVLCVGVVIYSNGSATPLSGFALGGVAAAFFLVRRHMRVMRWLAVIALIGLQLIMVNPIWHLMARVTLVSGDTGWYRYKLLDEFINHVSEWWIIGTTDYVSWWEAGFYAITNQYVLEGVRGGLITLALFIAIILLGFHGVGRILRRVRTMPHAALAWALGVGLVVHCSAFFAVSYFGQIIMIWFLLLAAIASLAPCSGRRRMVHAPLSASVPGKPSLRTAPVTPALTPATATWRTPMPAV